MFTAQIQVYHTKRHSEENIFAKEFHYSAETPGEVLDMMVAGSVELYKAAKDFVETHYDEQYDVDYDYWYVHVAHPALTRLETDKYTNTGGGSKLSNLESIIFSAAHYRYMEIADFFRQVRYAGDYSSYVASPMYYENFNYYDDIQDTIEKNLSGAHLDELIKRMGKDYERFLFKHSRSVKITKALKFKYADKYDDTSLLNFFEKIDYSVKKRNKARTFQSIQA